MRKARAGRLFGLLIMAAIILAACSPGDTTAIPQVPDAGQPAVGRLAAAQGGNLHYQNLVLAIDDQIIFNSENNQLTIANWDGSGSTALFKQAGGNLAVNDDRLFFTLGVQSGVLSKINLDGTNQVRIGSTPLKYLIFDKQTLYAVESGQGRVVALQTDGTGRRVLLDEKAASLAMANGKLYICGLDDAGGLLAFDPESGDKKQILSKRVSSLNINGDWLYYADPANNFWMHAWSLSEHKEFTISEFCVEKPFITSDGYLYYISTNEQNRLFRHPLGGNKSINQGDSVLVVDDAVSSFAVVGNFIYYQRPESRRIYRVSTSGGKSLRIT